MGIMEELQAHNIRDHETELALATAEQDRDTAKTALTTEQLAHADTRATLDQTRLDLMAVTAERDLLGAQLAECRAAAEPELPSGPTREQLVAAWGVCAHPTFATAPAYANPATWMGHVNDVGVKQIRGMFAIGNSQAAINCRAILALCRQYNIKWLMTLSPENWSVTPAEAQAKIKWLTDNGWLDVVLGFEGPNEPEAGDNVPTDWAQKTLNMCRAIWEARNQYAPGKLILGPSMHDIVEDNSNGAGYKALADLNIAQYVDRISLHSYPKGSTVLTGFEPRLELARIAYPAPMKVWLTETGWTTYPKAAGGGGPQTTTESDAATYGSEAPSIIAQHEVIEKAFRYELEDDALPADLSGVTNANRAEARYGIFRPDGSPKPEATALKAVLTGA